MNSNLRAIIKYDFELKEIKRIGKYNDLLTIHFVQESSKLYVIDEYQNRILIFDSNLNYKSQIYLNSYEFHGSNYVNFLNGEIFVGGYDKILLIRKDYSSTTQTDICQTVKQEHLLTQFTVTSKNLFLLHAMTKSE